MANEFDHGSEAQKVGKGFIWEFTRPIVIDAASRDPKGVAPTGVIPKGTPMAPVVATGKYRPLAYTLADGGCTTGQLIVPVTDTAPFAVGDIIRVVVAATPLAASLAVGTIESIQAGVSLTLTANSTTAVTSGEIITLALNDQISDAVILVDTVDLRNRVDATPVDTGASGGTVGSGPWSALNVNTAAGITLNRIKAALPLVDFISAVAGTYG